MRRKTDNPSVVAIDAQHRVCLPSSIQEEFGLRNGMHVYLTINHRKRILVFRTTKDLERHAHDLVEKAPRLSKGHGEVLLSRDKVRVTLDSRGRISLPENLRKESQLGDAAQVVVCEKRLEIAAPDVLAAQWEKIASDLRAFEDGVQS